VTNQIGTASAVPRRLKIDSIDGPGAKVTLYHVGRKA